MSSHIDMAAGIGSIICIPLYTKTQITATTADIATAIAPCKGRVVAVAAWVKTSASKPTDLDLMIEKGTTDLHTLIPAINSSTIAGPLMGALVTVAASLAVAAGDVFHLDATVTGGSSPTCDDIYGMVWMVRE